MEEPTTETLYKIVTSLVGAGGIFAFFLSWRKEKALARMTDASTFKIMQEAYNMFAKDMKFEIGQLKEEVVMLRAILKDRDKKCAACPNNPRLIIKRRKQ